MTEDIKLSKLDDEDRINRKENDSAANRFE